MTLIPFGVRQRKTFKLPKAQDQQSLQKITFLVDFLNSMG